MSFSLEDFVRESNRIEGIIREPTEEELIAHHGFLSLERIGIRDLIYFVNACQPGARLRDQEGLDVRVGSHVAPSGGPAIRVKLEQLLDTVAFDSWTPFLAHLCYETLHPFTDCNGRSGRALWLWMMGGIDKAPLGFLHHFYYQTLEETR